MVFHFIYGLECKASFWVYLHTYAFSYIHASKWIWPYWKRKSYNLLQKFIHLLKFEAQITHQASSLLIVFSTIHNCVLELEFNFLNLIIIAAELIGSNYKVHFPTSFEGKRKQQAPLNKLVGLSNCPEDSNCKWMSGGKDNLEL